MQFVNKILGKLFSGSLFLFVFLWSSGIVINNANLSLYGAFSWEIIDIGYFSSGALFFIAFLLIHVVIFNIVIEFTRNSNTYYSGINVLVIISLFIAITGITIGLIIKEIEILSYLIISFLLCILFTSATVLNKKNTQILFVRLLRLTFYIKKKDEVYGINGKVQFRRLLTNNFPGFLFIFILYLGSAYFFGLSAYGFITKAIGGGKPEYVQFGPNRNLTNFIDSDKTYRLLDQTFDDYIVFDLKDKQVIFVPKSNKEYGPIRFSKNEKISFSFASDLHLTTDTIGKSNKCTHINDVDRLIKYWRDHKYNRLFMLGDILESPEETSPTNRDSLNNEHKKLMIEFQNRIVSLSSDNLNFIIGNNDYRNDKQLSSFREKFYKYLDQDTVSAGIEWVKNLTNKVLAIGLYVPDKVAHDQLDPDKYDSVLRLINLKLKLILEYEYQKYDVIFILTHQGFTVDNIWSSQYDILRNKASKYIEKLSSISGMNDPVHLNETSFKPIKELLSLPDTTLLKAEVIYLINTKLAAKYNNWEHVVKDLCKTLRHYDNDFLPSIGYPNKKPDIVIVSGHYHDGNIIRELDGIDHITCPSYFEGSRRSNTFDRNSYTILDINYIPFEKRIEVVYRSLNKKIVSKASLYL